ncbi:MAG: M20/M25/M40 family metallo-hydrolase [Methanoregulaceae archaeon]|nr:M20/M25/M40 family metallo-hydrolase [Methanoregulaceae archaeon]
MDVVQLCADLVRIRSENPPGDTGDVIRYIGDFLDGIGIFSTVVGGDRGKLNLVTEGPDQPLILCGHVDVVPAMDTGWSHGPYSGDVAEGMVWGRGSTDMKGGCAAILWAVRELVEKGGEPTARLVFVCDEETSGMNGIQCVLAKRLISPCDVLIAEPTHPHHPNIGQKGLIRANVSFRGEPGHGSLYPDIGVSAVMEAYGLINYLGHLNRREYHPGAGLEEVIRESGKVFGEVFCIPDAGSLLRKIMYNPGKIEGGEKSNIVAQHCNLELDIRVPLGCSAGDLLGELRGYSPRADLKCVSISEPSLTPADSRIVRTTCRNIGEVFGIDSTPLVQWAASDARFLRTRGFRVVEYGPGDITRLHSVDERTPIESLHAAVEIYGKIMKDYEGST